MTFWWSEDNYGQLLQCYALQKYLRAAVKCPPLLILDEPCHGLDEEQRSLVLHLLETIAATGTTTLLHVTHDPTEVLSCERHILELYQRQSPEDDHKECYRIMQG